MMKDYPGEVEIPADTIIATGVAADSKGQVLTDIIFDFGNVLVKWDPHAAMVSRYSSADIERMLNNDISGFYEANGMMDRGCSKAEAVAWVQTNYGEPWDQMFEYYCDNAIDSITGPVPGARKLLEDLKAAGIGVWGLSNWSAETFPLAWERCEILHMLDGKVISGYVNMAKPGKEIFDFALKEFNIEAKHSLFVDDLGLNVLGANAAGIRGLRFESPYGLRAALIRSGIDIPGVR